MLSQLRDTFLESLPLVPLRELEVELPRVCPPSLAWCLQLWSPLPTHGQQLPALSPGQLPQGFPPQSWAIRDGSPGPPILSPRMPSSGLAQLSCLPLLVPYSPDHHVPPRKSLQLGEGSSVASSTAACHKQRAQPGDVVVAGGGAVWTLAPLCPAQLGCLV